MAPATISLFKRSNGIWYLKITRRTPSGAARVRWKSTGCRIKREALRALRSIELEADRAEHALPEFTSLKHEILTYAEANYARHTCYLYRLCLARLEECFPDMGPAELTPRYADEYKRLRLAAVKPGTMSLELRTLRAAFSLAVRWGLLTDNPFSGIRLPKSEQHLPRYFTPEQFAALLEEISEEWLRDIAVFAAATGLRQGEILHLPWEQVLTAQRLLLVESGEGFRTKAGRARTLPLGPAAIEVLGRRQELRETDDAEDLVFTFRGKPIRRDTLTHKFKASVRAAGLPEYLCFHSLRHTFASWLAQAGVSLYEIGTLLGHADPSTTKMYSHLRPQAMHPVLEAIQPALLLRNMWTEAEEDEEETQATVESVAKRQDTGGMLCLPPANATC